MKYPVHELYFPEALKGTKGLNCLEEGMKEWEDLKKEKQELLRALKLVLKRTRQCHDCWEMTAPREEKKLIKQALRINYEPR